MDNGGDMFTNHRKEEGDVGNDDGLKQRRRTSGGDGALVATGFAVKKKP